MTKSEFLESQKIVATKIRRGILGYAGIAIIVVSLNAFLLSENLIPEDFHTLSVGFVIATMVIVQVLAFRRIRSLTKSIYLVCNSCKQHLGVGAEKLSNVIDNNNCTFCGNSVFSVTNT
jgi:hypothetical protein